MPRALAVIAVTLGMAAVLAAGLRLAVGTVTPGLRMAVASPVADDPSPMMAAAVPLPFAPIFGQTPTMPTVVAKSQSAPARPDLTLRGTLILGDTRRAFFDAPAGEIALGEGEFLTADLQVAVIRQGQVTVLVDGVPMQFDFGPSGQARPAAAVARTAASQAPRVASYQMTQTDIMALLNDPRAHPTTFAFDR